jgi:hypothetical protein
MKDLAREEAESVKDFLLEKSNELAPARACPYFIEV